MTRWPALVVAFSICAAMFGQPKAVFPDDGKSPDQRTGREYLQAVCPGHVSVSPKIGCGEYCPSFTGFGEFGDNFEWYIEEIIRGHFLSAGSDDAVLSMAGCEPHSTNFGGTILLSRKSGTWKMLWYKAGVDTSRCHKVRLKDGRDILLCLGEAGGQGNVTTDLYLEDLLNPTPSLMAGSDSAFFSMFDNTLTCGFDLIDDNKANPITQGVIDKVEVGDVTRNTTPSLAVTVRFGRKLMTPGEVQTCINEIRSGGSSSFMPPAKTYRLEFVFDGAQFKLTRDSLAVARTFSER